MKKLAVIVGAGDMGVAAAYAFHKLGYGLVLVDPLTASHENAVSKLNSFGISVKHLYSEVGNLPNEVLINISVVLSCAPYYINKEIVKWCIQHDLKYCDLGGNTLISESLQKQFVEFDKGQCFTDLGLAPGWANIIAEQGYLAKSVEGKVSAVKIYVGGLPTEPKGQLKYNLVFSVKGLLNEYSGKALTLENNEIKEVDTLSGIEEVRTPFKNAAWLESFHTSGGLASTLQLMKNRGVKTCCYKTLRFSGHVNLIRFMLCELNMTSEAFESYITSVCPKTNKDQVFIVIKVEPEGLGSIWEKEICVKHNDDWTAMQMTTAWPAVAVADCMVDNLMNSKNRVFTYADVPYQAFSEKLACLDLVI